MGQGVFPWEQDGRMRIGGRRRGGGVIGEAISQQRRSARRVLATGRREGKMRRREVVKGRCAWERRRRWRRPW